LAAHRLFACFHQHYALDDQNFLVSNGNKIKAKKKEIDMKLSSNWQIAITCLALLAVAGAAIFLNPTKVSKTAKTPASEKKLIEQAENSFAVINARVFDGDKTFDKASVLVQSGKITAIGSNIKIPKGIPTYDGTGKTLLPGFIDSHTHTYGDAQKEALRFGVTTELDMFSDWRGLAAAKKQRESFAKFDQADLWSAGTLATVPGGHGTEYGMKIPTLSSPNEAAAFVQARIAEGSDYIKIVFDDGSAYGPDTKMKSLNAQTTKALIQAAHANQKKALVHIASISQAKTMLDQSADGLVHIFIDQIADPRFIAQAKKRNMFIVPTLSVTASLAAADEGKNLAGDLHLKAYLTLPQSNALKASFPAQWQNPAALKNALANVKLLHQAGVPILAGTDAGNPSTTHGASMHGELSLLVRAGLSPVAALNAATALPAKVFGLNDRGKIALGMRADLILVNGDPTKTITDTRKIDVIWKNGYRHTRTKTANTAQELAELPSSTQISDFENGKMTTQYGNGWHITTDEQMGGNSAVDIKLIADGANRSKGALEVSGEIKMGFAYPWAGVFFMPGSKAMQAVNYRQSKELVFWVKGDGRSYTAMAFSGTPLGAPPSQSFKTTSQWQQIRLPLNGFEGLELSQVTGFSFNASAPKGKFRFAIDNVEIK
jgi:imidazolonepropionase-like amidohydrolase